MDAMEYLTTIPMEWSPTDHQNAGDIWMSVVKTKQITENDYTKVKLYIAAAYKSAEYFPESAARAVHVATLLEAIVTGVEERETVTLVGGE